MTHDDDTCPHLVRANLLEAENARLKAEVERLESENANNCDIKEHWFLACKSARKGEAEYLEQVERLKAEVERLMTELKEARMKDDVWYVPIEELKHSQMMREMIKSDANKLKAQVERLTKAGDAMWDALLCSGCSECMGMYDCHDEAMKLWDAAKEGKHL